MSFTIFTRGFKMFFQKKIFQNILFFSFFYSFPALASFLELELEHYTSPPITSDQLQDYAFLKGGYDYNFEKKGFYFNSEVQFEYSLDFKNWLHFDVPQLFVSYKYDFQKLFFNIESIEFSIGRKIQVWSEGDRYWGLGLWNPLILWNPLHPEEKGSVGSFITFNSNNWKSDFFIGVFHFPDSVPHFREKNQETYTHSRWGTLLPRTVDQYNLNIYYTLKRTFLFDYINQQSFFGSFSTWSQKEDSRYWIKWSLAYKPTNHIYYLLNELKKVRISAEENRPAIYVDQQLTGVYVRQRILSTEWGLDYKNLSMVFSLENIKMREERFLEKEIWDFSSSIDGFSYFSFLSKYYYWNQSFIELGFIQSWFGNYNSYSNTDTFPVYLSQHRVSNGFSVALEHKGFHSKELSFVLNLKYQYSFLDEGDWLSAQALCYLSPKIYTKVSAHLMGLDRLNESKRSFLEKFYYNDHFTWSLAYDF